MRPPGRYVTEDCLMPRTMYNDNVKHTMCNAHYTLYIQCKDYTVHCPNFIHNLLCTHLQYEVSSVNGVHNKTDSIQLLY